MTDSTSPCIPKKKNLGYGLTVLWCKSHKSWVAHKALDGFTKVCDVYAQKEGCLCCGGKG